MLPNTPDVSRRTITKSAAWGVPAVAVAAAAPAFSTSADHHTGPWIVPLTFRVFAGLNKVATPALFPDEQAPPYTTPAGWLDQDIWDVVVTTDFLTSIPPNSTLPAPPLSVQVTTSYAAAETLLTFGVAAVGGSLTTFTNIVGNVVNPGIRQTVLALPVTQSPPPDNIGPLVIAAEGNAQPETSTTAGSITQSVALNFLANLDPGGSAFITAIGLIGALEPAGQNTDLGWVTVG